MQTAVADLEQSSSTHIDSLTQRPEYPAQLLCPAGSAEHITLGLTRMLLFKYRSLDKASAEFTLKILSAQETYFSKPDSFNDPFEFRPQLSLEATKEEFATYLDGLYKRRCPWLNRQQRKESVAAILKDKSRNHQSGEVAKLLGSAISDISRLCGVYCLSEDPTNILMWSHYADCHRGICFGFDGAETNPFFGRAQQVSYQEHYPVANLIKDHPGSYQDKVILSKASFWAYEREWRIIEHERGNGIYRFDENDLKQVIFGVKTSADDIETVLKVLKDKHLSPQLLRAHLHGQRYALVLAPYQT